MYLLSNSKKVKLNNKDNNVLDPGKPGFFNSEMVKRSPEYNLKCKTWLCVNTGEIITAECFKEADGTMRKATYPFNDKVLGKYDMCFII